MYFGQKENKTFFAEESDADVEDNVEIEGLLPEVGEPSCSSEKQSTLASPASPSTDPKKPTEAMNDVPLDNYLQLNAADSVSVAQLENRYDTNSLPRYID